MLSVRDTIYQAIEKNKAARVKFENYHTPVVHLFYSIGTHSYRVSHDTFNNTQEIARLNGWRMIENTLHTNTWMQ